MASVVHHGRTYGYRTNSLALDFCPCFIYIGYD